MTLAEQKRAARENYKKARAEYLENQTKENWIKFCECKRTCMLLGCII